jgi:hypothetical protein
LKAGRERAITQFGPVHPGGFDGVIPGYECAAHLFAEIVEQNVVVLNGACVVSHDAFEQLGELENADLQSSFFQYLPLDALL